METKEIEINFDISDIEGGRPCPRCGDIHGISHYQLTSHYEGGSENELPELVYWDVVAECGATGKIWND